MQIRSRTVARRQAGVVCGNSHTGSFESCHIHRCESQSRVLTDACRCFPCILPGQDSDGPVLVKLPAEDCCRKDVRKIGPLKKSMYGTRDAASNWENKWQRHLGSWNYELGRSSRNLFRNKKERTSGLTHGDDFVVTGLKGVELKRGLESLYPIKASIIGANSAKSIKALNRRICCGERDIESTRSPTR